MRHEMMQTANYPESHPTSHEDQRTLQIALELSNLGLLGNCDDDSSTSSYDEITKSKKSQNMTECVPVPSSEHVAEIVGRQGCKIKALRAKTNTYIKTPVRGEEPVFVVTGRKEDVAMARREVQSAAEHFTQIRATRNKHAMINGQTTATSDGDCSPGTITLQVRVPYRVVGLVVGPKGATIKRIQQQTHTYIVTPSRDKEPVFEVTGLPENVEKAKEEIEAHIATRTGTQQQSIDDDFKNNGTEVGNLAGSVPKSSSTSYHPSLVNGSVLRSQAPSFFPNQPTNTTFDQRYSNGLYAPMLLHHNEALMMKQNNWSSMDAQMLTPRRTSHSSSVGPQRLSPTLSDCDMISSRGRVSSESIESGVMDPGVSFAVSPAVNIESGYSSGGTTDSLTSGSPDTVHGVAPYLAEGEFPRCTLCNDGSVVATLMPCRHQVFCFPCANRVVSRSASFCPYCHNPATMALLVQK
uniref:PEM-3 n=1 Tax=Ciona savignyi TaxID=51511 RepID=Q9NDU4_CIOSA|nr:PEM-3 [Ciona savignyi]